MLSSMARLHDPNYHPMQMDHNFSHQISILGSYEVMDMEL